MRQAKRLYTNTSSIKERSFGGAKFWALIVDENGLLEFRDKEQVGSQVKD
jgi:hypothetical protein